MEQLLYSSRKMSVYRSTHCKLTKFLRAIVQEIPGLRKHFNCFIALLSLKTVSKLCTQRKRTENNFRMHIMLNCSFFLTGETSFKRIY